MIVAIVPSRTDEYLGALFLSMERSQVGSTSRVVVADNGLSPAFRAHWFASRYVRPFAPDEPFVFAKALNAGAATVAAPDVDLLMLNDDTEIAWPQRGWLAALEGALAASYTQPYGLLGLRVLGGVGNPEQQDAVPDGCAVPAYKTLCFTGVVIRASAWATVGSLDEQFIGYGHEDDDFCHRARQAGIRLGVLGTVVIRHGKPDATGGVPHSASFARYNTREEWGRQAEVNRRLFLEKWGLGSGGRL